MFCYIYIELIIINCVYIRYLIINYFSLIMKQSLIK